MQKFIPPDTLCGGGRRFAGSPLLFITISSNQTPPRPTLPFAPAPPKRAVFEPAPA
jgi:hypothetical protein